MMIKLPKLIHLEMLTKCAQTHDYNSVIFFLNTELWGLVNNAGICYFGEAELMPVNLYQKLWETNCLGQVRMVKAFMPMLRKSKGRIVNVTSVAGKVYILGI